MPRAERLILAACLAFAAAVFLPGIKWGLPSRAVDPYLFGGRPVWTGQEILALTGGWGGDDEARGADVDRNPLADRDRPILLNATDAQRAEIVQRYRIQSNQPDEHITFRALSRIRPGQFQFDPGLYQYGGLWTYPVGAMLKVGSLLGLVDVRADVAFYLDHPEAFGRFYVVARLYSALWGLVATWAVFRLAKRLGGSTLAAAAGAMCFAAMPVVVNMAHEAKPHLPGLALMLLTVLAACRYVESGMTRWWLTAGALCGAAFGMVISSLIVFSVLPVMALLRPIRWVDRMSITVRAAGIGLLVYAITNPYVWINAIWNPDVLRSNIGTSTAMYEATPGSGLANAVRLIGQGTGPALAVLGLVALPLVAWMLLRSPGKFRDAAWNRASSSFWLLAVPAGIVCVQFALLAAGKPAEYARFALLPDTLICLSAVFAASRLKVRGEKVVTALALCVLPICSGIAGGVYVAHFIADAGSRPSRLAYAETLHAYKAKGMSRLAVVAEPAPYVMPPVDLWEWEILLLPRVPEPPTALAEAVNAHVLVRAEDGKPSPVADSWSSAAPVPRAPLGATAPISWASKPFGVLVNADPAAGGRGVP